MERPEFEITIKSNGKLKVHIKGVKGRRCIEMAELIKEIVGREDHRQWTGDYYEQEGKVRIHAQATDRRCDVSAGAGGVTGA